MDEDDNSKKLLLDDHQVGVSCLLTVATWYYIVFPALGIWVRNEASEIQYEELRWATSVAGRRAEPAKLHVMLWLIATRARKTCRDDRLVTHQRNTDSLVF